MRPTNKERIKVWNSSQIYLFAPKIIIMSSVVFRIISTENVINLKETKSHRILQNSIKTH